MKLYDLALKAFNLAIPEFKKEGYTDKDIQDGFDLAKRLLNRLILKKDAVDALNKAYVIDAQERLTELQKNVTERYSAMLGEPNSNKGFVVSGTKQFSMNAID